jgi:catechol 2,3-dioxygenase-like lactoylglutathione lyase family enzyme
MPDVSVTGRHRSAGMSPTILANGVAAALLGRFTSSPPDQQPKAVATLEPMTVQRLDHVGIVVDDLAAATAFFVELGLELQGEAQVDGAWVDRIVALEGVRSEIVMMEAPGGHGRIELTKFHAPPSPGGDRRGPANAPGIRHITFAVDDLDATLARLGSQGAELVGEVERYSDIYRLCYVRGPEGIIVELAERIG